MPGPFTITPSSALVTLEDEKRQGTVTFTVKNDTSRRIRATARLILPAGSPAESWLAILQPGDSGDTPELPGTVRTFDLGQTQPYIVRIAAPRDAVPATHTFQLVVADETNPDDLFTESTAVTVVLNAKPEPPPPPPPFPYWIIPVILVVLAIIVGAIILLTRPDDPPQPDPTATPTVTNTPVTPTATRTRTPTRTPLPRLSLSPNMPLFGEFFVGNDYFMGDDPTSLTPVENFSVAEFEAEGFDSFDRLCAGFISSQPFFLVQVDPPSQNLAFFFQSTNGDTTLIILDPEGNIHCNDDVQGFQPGLNFFDVQPGEYFIWIGHKEPDRGITGLLHITSDCNYFFNC
ncbi:MAG: hypothetical protein SF162_11675 [bacterium]|nr:hypothetical protein [bacterium]